MKTLKVIDFDAGLGGFTTGLEKLDSFEVVGAPLLNEKNNLCYNLNHKNFFEYDVEDKKGIDFDIATFTPNFGEKYNRKGCANFSYNDINRFILWINNNSPKIFVIITNPDIIPFMKIDNVLSYTADEWPVYDLIHSRLSSNYNIYQFVIDGAKYGVPQHKKINFYLGFDKNISNNILKIPQYTYKNNDFITIKDAIGDIMLDNYSDYSSTYIIYCRQNNPKITWHAPNYRYHDNCSVVAEGSSAKKTSELTQKTGYNRPKFNKICPPLFTDFYTTSSKWASIHPIKNRPFTIREGARLFGLPDTFVWNSKLSNKEVANLIFNSTSPIFGTVVGEIILNYINEPSVSKNFVGGPQVPP